MVFYELGDHLVFRRSPVASKLRPLAGWTVASLILVAVASSALFAETGRERVVMAIQILEYSANVVSIGLIFAILLLTRALRISWSSLPVGIALGFSVCACADLAAAALISVVGKVGWVGIDFIAMGAFHVAVVIWLLYIFLPPSDRVSPGIVRTGQTWKRGIRNCKKWCGDGRGLFFVIPPNRGMWDAKSLIVACNQPRYYLLRFCFAVSFGRFAPKYIFSVVFLATGLFRMTGSMPAL